MQYNKVTYYLELKANKNGLYEEAWKWLKLENKYLTLGIEKLYTDFRKFHRAIPILTFCL
jgi:hypothetical protein